MSQKVAIITGAGTGIGAAVAKRLAALNWSVIVSGRRKEKLDEVVADIVAAGGTAKAVACDVTLPDDVKNLIDSAGPTLDALIHSAGQGHCLTIDELDFEEWKQTMDVSVTGAFLTAKAALPKIRTGSNGPGFVMQICSLASGGTWNLEVGYGTAKGAQCKFALHLASQFDVEAEAGGRKIYSHAVCPGTTDTPFWDRIPQRSADPELTLTGDEVAWVVEELIQQPELNAEDLSAKKPRAEIVVKRHAPFERFDNVVAIAHESHP